MTIDNEHKNISSIPNQATQFGSHEDDTPRRIPIPPQHTTWSSLPPTAASPYTRGARRRRVAVPIVITLVLLSILIILGGFLGQHLLAGSGVAAGQTSTVQNTGPTGQFVHPPLSSSQLDSLRHLVSHMQPVNHMQYKQLASMYVARMSLDVELGQLIMVEYGDTTYSSDLDMMVNQLHAGGVIMYEFQMNTFNQTKHDIAAMQKRATFPLLISTDEEGGPYV